MDHKLISKETKQGCMLSLCPFNIFPDFQGNVNGKEKNSLRSEWERKIILFGENFYLRICKIQVHQKTELKILINKFKNGTESGSLGLRQSFLILVHVEERIQG